MSCPMFHVVQVVVGRRVFLPGFAAVDYCVARDYLHVVDMAEGSLLVIQCAVGYKEGRKQQGRIVNYMLNLGTGWGWKLGLGNSPCHGQSMEMKYSIQWVADAMPDDIPIFYAGATCTCLVKEEEIRCAATRMCV